MKHDFNLETVFFFIFAVTLIIGCFNFDNPTLKECPQVSTGNDIQVEAPNMYISLVSVF